MKLSELHSIFDALEAERKTWPEPQNADELAEQYQREFEVLPRVKYVDLPASLQKTVRERFTPCAVRDFLVECFSFDEAVKNIPEKDIDKIIIRTRNTATYVIEWPYQDMLGQWLIMPSLYGNYAVAAFVDALAQYKRPRTPIQRRKSEENKIDSWARLPAAKMPSSPLTYMFARVLNAGPQGPKASRINRHEKIGIAHNAEQKATQYTRINKNRKDTITVFDPEKTLSGKGRAISKMFFFMLQCWAYSGYGHEFTFPLSDLVDLGMNDSIEAARIAVKKFMERQTNIHFSSQTTNAGKKEKSFKWGIVFYHAEIENNNVSVYVNEKMDMRALANFFTVLPLFSYKLSTMAFYIVNYIMYLARQKGDELSANNGKFHVSLEAIRQYLELPSPAEVQNYKYYEKIREPIESALEEIEENMPKDEYHFTMTARYKDDSSIKSWLDGDLEIELPAEMAAQFIDIADKAEKHYKQHQRDLEQAQAKAQAIIAAKAEQKKKNQNDA